MFGLLIKKSFFDLWDHLILNVLMNVGFLMLMAFPILLPPVFSAFPPPLNTLLSFASIIVGVTILHIYLGAVATMAREVADFKRPDGADFMKGLKETWKKSLSMGLFNVLVIFMLLNAVNFYASLESPIASIAVGLVTATMVVWTLSVQVFFPVMTRLEQGFFASLKKMFLLFFDNAWVFLVLFACVVGLFSLSTIPPLVSDNVVMIIPGLTALLMVPGIAGLMIWYQNAMRFIMMKYDYFEQNPEARKGRIPWRAILIEEKERVGSRSFRGMIFPWKQG